MRAGPEQRDRWNGFVASRPQANLGHLFEWGDVFASAYGKRSHYLAVLDGDAWAGVLPLVHMAGPIGGNRLVSLPFLDQAGVLADTREIASLLLERALQLARELGAQGVDLRAPPRRSGALEERATLEIALPPDVDGLWTSIPGKVRNQIRKARSSGLETFSAGRERFGDCYRIFASRMRDLGSPVHSRAFFESIFDALKDRTGLYLTRDARGAIVGGAVAIRTGRAVTVPWAASLRDAFPLCPNHSLYWKILEDSVSAKAGVFDFGRSHVGSGAFRFKTQWGAEPKLLQWVSYDADGRRVRPPELRPGEYSAITRLWSRLPLGIASALGPMLRRYLSN